MVAVLHHTDVGGNPQSAQDGPQLFGRAEGVARTLDEQHRRADVGQVLRPQLVGTARRVQRIAEEHQAAMPSCPAAATWKRCVPPSTCRQLPAFGDRRHREIFPLRTASMTVR